MSKRSTIFAAVFGTVVTLGVLLSLGATQSTVEQVGRYQIVIADKHAMVVDTVNGVVWDQPLWENVEIPDNSFRKAKR